MHALQNIRAVLFIAEPGFFYPQRRGIVIGHHRLKGRLFDSDFLLRKGFCQPPSALPDSQRAIACSTCLIKDPDRCRQCRKHLAFPAMKQCAHLSWGVIGNDFSLFHHHHTIRCVINIFQAMLGDNDGCAQFDVDLPNSIQKIGSGNGIQLAGRFIQHQHLRLHSHNGRQVQKLLLTTGKGGHILVKPALDTEIAGHFRNPQPHGLLIAAQRFQAKGQFMPYLIGDDLIIGILHHKADLSGLFRLGHLGQRLCTKQNLTASLTMRHQHGF